MLGKLFECEADKNKKYYRVIQTIKEYRDGKRFPINEIYKVSSLNEISYFRAMTACAICGYINTALKVCEDRVNTQNIGVAISELEAFCKRREEEHYEKNILEIESVKIIYDKLKEIQNNKNN